MTKVPVLVQTVGLLLVSNVFMTFAWYAHLKNPASKPVLLAALANWLIALFEYLLQVPANRIGYTEFSSGPAKNPPGSHHTLRFRSLRPDVHE